MSARRLSTRELAKRWDLRPRTISRWCREGRIRAEKWGRVWRIPEDEVRRIEAEHVSE